MIVKLLDLKDKDKTLKASIQKPSHNLQRQDNVTHIKFTK